MSLAAAVKETRAQVRDINDPLPPSTAAAHTTGTVRTTNFQPDVNCDLKVSQSSKQDVAQKLLCTTQKRKFFLNSNCVIFLLHRDEGNETESNLIQLTAQKRNCVYSFLETFRFIGALISIITL